MKCFVGIDVSSDDLKICDMNTDGETMMAY